MNCAIPGIRVELFEKSRCTSSRPLNENESARFTCGLYKDQFVIFIGNSIFKYPQFPSIRYLIPFTEQHVTRHKFDTNNSFYTSYTIPSKFLDIQLVFIQFDVLMDKSRNGCLHFYRFQVTYLRNKKIKLGLFVFISILL